MRINVKNFLLVAALFGAASSQDIPVNANNIHTAVRLYLNEGHIFEDISLWDTSEVTDMSFLFQGQFDFNSDISAWDVSKVTNMRSMFSSCDMFNISLADWDVSNVTDMNDMFYNARSFDQDLSSWDVSKVTDMRGMFEEAVSFNSEIGSWDVSSVTSMSHMFVHAELFNQDLNDWNVSSVEVMTSTFESALVFDGDISDWNVSRVFLMENMFKYAAAFDSDISDWDVSSVTKFDSMFYGAASFNADLTHWDVSSSKSMRNMFRESLSFEQQRLCWNMGAMDSAFEVEDMFWLSTEKACFDPSCVPNNDFVAQSASTDNCMTYEYTFCFSGEMEVEIMNGPPKAMKDLAIGDYVKTGINSYSPVYSFGHYSKDTEKDSEYLQITSRSLPKALEISKRHLVFVEDGRGVPAGHLAVGDKLQLGDGDFAVIDSIQRVIRRDAYAPFTLCGTIVVNNVVASNYVSMTDDADSVLAVGGRTLLSHHWVAHVWQTPHRLFCQYVSECSSESYTAEGLSHWVAGPYQVSSWFLEQYWLVQLAVFVPVMVVTHVLFILEWTAVPLALAALMFRQRGKRVRTA